MCNATHMDLHISGDIPNAQDTVCFPKIFEHTPNTPPKYPTGRASWGPEGGVYLWQINRSNEFDVFFNHREIVNAYMCVSTSYICSCLYSKVSMSVRGRILPLHMFVARFSTPDLLTSNLTTLIHEVASESTILLNTVQQQSL